MKIQLIKASEKRLNEAISKIIDCQFPCDQYECHCLSAACADEYFSGINVLENELLKDERVKRPTQQFSPRRLLSNHFTFGHFTSTVDVFDVV